MGFPRREYWEWLFLLASSLVSSVTPSEFLATIMVVTFVVVQSLSCVQPFVTPWTRACQAFLSTNSRSLFKVMSIELVMPSSSLVLSCPLLLPSVFPASESFPVKRLEIYIANIRLQCCQCFVFNARRAKGTSSGLMQQLG